MKSLKLTLTSLKSCTTSDIKWNPPFVFNKQIYNTFPFRFEKSILTFRVSKHVKKNTWEYTEEIGVSNLTGQW